MLTPSILFDRSLYVSGSEHCYYCGSNCSDSFTTQGFVKKTFTNRDIVKKPGSGYVCGGCVSSFNEKCEILLVSGEKRDSQRVRSYSWVISESKKTAATKSHIEFLRTTCLNPPDPPFVIVLADSAQKHLIFRAVIAVSRNQFPVMLEEEVIQVIPEMLNERIEKLKLLIAVTGKPALADRFSDINLAIRLFENYGGEAEQMLNYYFSVRDEPLTRLALWLSPKKEDCENELAGRTINSTGIPT